MDERPREPSHRAAPLPETDPRAERPPQPETAGERAARADKAAAPHLEAPVSREPDRRPARIGCVLLLLIMIGAAVYGGVYYSRHRDTAGAGKGAEGGKGGPGGKRPVPVTVAKAERGDVPVQIKVVGSVTPYKTVAVTSQVGGQLLEVAFRQGDFVRKGQVLFQIDPRPLQAALDQVRAQMNRDRAQINQARLTVAKDAALVRQAQANLARDQAQLTYAQAQNRRYGGLLHEGYVTAEQAEQQSSTARSLEATVQADRANVASVQASLNADASNVQILQANLEADGANERNAMVQLGYTTIRAPLDGRTGALNLYAGAVVRANDTTPLITIDQITPAYVSFAVPERYLEQIRLLQRASPLSVLATLGGQDGSGVERGRVSFIDNTVDTTTGTITLRATFPNPSHKLWPGHYINVTLMLGQQRNVVLVPEQAVQPGQKGDYVFVVKPDDTVDSRTVTVDRTVGGKAVITKGLKAGETVVTDGQLQLVPGAQIRVRKPGEDAAPAGSERRHRRGDASGAPAGGPSGQSAPGEGASAGAGPGGEASAQPGRPYRQAAPAEGASAEPAPGGEASARPGRPYRQAAPAEGASAQPASPGGSPRQTAPTDGASAPPGGVNRQPAPPDGAAVPSPAAADASPGAHHRHRPR